MFAPASSISRFENNALSGYN